MIKRRRLGERISEEVTATKIRLEPRKKRLLILIAVTTLSHQKQNDL